MKSTRHILLTLLVPLIGAGGCILPFGPEDLRRAASRSGKMKLKQKIGLSVDGVTLGVLGGIANVPVPLHHVFWADVGIYEISGTTDGRPVQSCLRRMDLPGWDRIVRTRERDSETCVLVKRRGSSINGVVVMARDGRELVIARVTGRMHAFLRDILAGHGGTGLFEFGGGHGTEITVSAEAATQTASAQP